MPSKYPGMLTFYVTIGVLVSEKEGFKNNISFLIERARDLECNPK